jgi:hypothetical protein
MSYKELLKTWLNFGRAGVGIPGFGTAPVSRETSGGVD